MKKYNFSITVTTRILLILIVFVGAIVCSRMLTAKYIMPKVDEDNFIVKIVMYKSDYAPSEEPEDLSAPASSEEESMWIKKYPFSENATESIVAPKSDTHSSTWTEMDSKVRKKWSSFTSVVEDFSSKYLPLYTTMINKTNELKASIGWDIPEPNAYNPVLFLDDGYLGLANSRYDYVTAEKSLLSFKTFTDKQNLPLIYIAAPSKINPADKSVYGIVDFSGQNTQGLLDLAKKDGINCYDLKDEIDKKYSNRHDGYYKTDLHWKTETGLFVAKCIADRLNKDMSFNISTNLLNENNFYSDVYENALLGSQGRKVTATVASPEDISFIYPNFKTKYHVSIPSKNFDKNGDFSMLYSQEILKIIRNGNPDYNRYDPYAAFMQNGNAQTRVINKNADNDLKLLVIYDSFGRTVAPFLSVCVNQMDCLDLRRFDGSLETYINTEGPYDAVLILYNPGAMSLQSEGQKLFDFR